MCPATQDARFMMNVSSADFRSKRGKMPCGLSQPERRIKAFRLQYNGNQPSSTGQVERIHRAATTKTGREFPKVKLPPTPVSPVTSQPDLGAPQVLSHHILATSIRASC
ncbi:unnamed protein product [Protopolystoma xenopodis]|uniref:Uncharacterized protein n=1 Tax=Protopolystoma xenopodis TaxID=117903 RepID=A0A3S4ZNE3_9PLAT|nr:unnamed protein product [Protopolystoma xenopodis]